MDPRFMRFLKVLGAFAKWGLIGILNDWAALLEEGLYTELYSVMPIVCFVLNDIALLNLFDCG